MRTRALLFVGLLGLLGCAQASGRSPGNGNDPPGSGAGGDPDTGGGGPGPSPAGGKGGSSGSQGGSGPISPGADAGSSAADGSIGGPSDAAPGGSMACAQLVPVSAASFSDLPAGPGTVLRVSVVPARPASVSWTWSVVFGAGAGTDVPVTALDAQATQVEFPVDREGQYRLSALATIDGEPCAASALASAAAPANRLGHFRARITPPAGIFPPQELAVPAMAGVPLARGLMLEQGVPVPFEPQDELGTHGVASYVRVTQRGSSLAVEGHTGNADFRPPLLALNFYDVIMVPDEEIAPFVVLGKMPDALKVISQKLAPGSLLTGKLADGAGRPLSDGRVILRAGALTSTVGASGDAGDFSLRVRAGQFSVTVAPRPESGLPELDLAPENGLAVVDGQSAGAVEVKWAPVTPAPVGLVVRTADNQLAGGARLRLELLTPIAAAGTLIHHAANGATVMHTVPGYVRVSAQVASDGSIKFPAVPPGQYRLMMTPADTDRLSALTSVTLDVPGAGLAARAVRLAMKVKLNGNLLPAGETQGTRVFASPQDADPPRPVASTTVSAAGTYQLDVDPGRSYVVWADPGLGKPLARAQLVKISSGASGAQVPDRTLPKALAFSGKLTGGNAGAAVPNAVIQLFCDVAAATCLDPEIALGEGVSDRNGNFALTLPDPAGL
jgi:hypothetical protein